MTAPVLSRAGRPPAHRGDDAPGAGAPRPEDTTGPDGAAGDRSGRRSPLQLVDRRVRVRRRSRARARLAGAAAVTAVLAVVFALVAIHVLLAQNQFELDRLDTRSSAAEAQYDRLRLQVAQLESPERVVATAEGRLGMVQPPKITYLTPKTAAPAAVPAAAPNSAQASPAVSADWTRVKAQLGARP